MSKKIGVWIQVEFAEETPSDKINVTAQLLKEDVLTMLTEVAETAWVGGQVQFQAGISGVVDPAVMDSITNLIDGHLAAQGIETETLDIEIGA